MKFNPAILAAAGRYLGIEEWPGARQNPAVLEFFQKSGNPQINDDETSWCAAFVGAVLAELGLPNTGRLNARSYLEWGAPVGMAEAKPGDVVVLWRGNPQGWQGHVAFLLGFERETVILRGGNQGNRVSDGSYPASRILGIRRAVAASETGQPILRAGQHGAAVRDLQNQLSALGYWSGAADGQFGSRTQEAVLAFQADNNLPSDAIVGGKTWAALEIAVPRKAREVDAATLRGRGSTTIRNADTAQAGTTVAMLLGGGTIALERADGAIEAMEKAGDLLDHAAGVFGALWPVLAIAGLGLTVWYLLSEIKRARVEDARSGKHVGR
jgi:uncharacterized protein (TIGR02594 family)